MSYKPGEKIATRVALGNYLKVLGDDYDDIIVLDADLSGSTKSKVFAGSYPDYFFNAGISEANMVGIAAGLASQGFKVFANTFAIFLTSRADDFIYNSIARSNLDVVLCGSHGGFVGKDGPSHHALRDLGAMCSIPNMKVIEPCDANEVEEVLDWVMEYDGGPVYIRTRRDKSPVLYRAQKFKLGEGEILKQAYGLDSTAIIASGNCVHEALEATKEMPDITVINMSSLKPLDEELIRSLPRGHSRYFVVQEHYRRGGLGQAVSEILSQSPFYKGNHFYNLCVEDEFQESADVKDLRALARLDAKGIRDHLDSYL